MGIGQFCLMWGVLLLLHLQRPRIAVIFGSGYGHLDRSSRTNGLSVDFDGRRLDRTFTLAAAYVRGDIVPRV